MKVKRDAKEPQNFIECNEYAKEKKPEEIKESKNEREQSKMSE